MKRLLYPSTRRRRASGLPSLRSGSAPFRSLPANWRRWACSAPWRRISPDGIRRGPRRHRLWLGRRPGGSAFRRNAGAYSRKALLVGLMLILAFSCLAATRSYSMFALMSARMIGALAHGAFWALIGIVAAQLVPPHRLGLATAIIFGGVSAASVVGVPLASFIATLAGWRPAFMSMALLSLAAAAVLCSTLPRWPPLPRQAACLSRYLPQSAARWPVWRHGLHHYRSLCRLHLH